MLMLGGPVSIQRAGARIATGLIMLFPVAGSESTADKRQQSAELHVGSAPLKLHPPAGKRKTSAGDAVLIAPRDRENARQNTGPVKRAVGRNLGRQP